MFKFSDLKNLFEKARNIKYNSNDLSLFDNFGKPAEYNEDFTPKQKFVPGQERPNHKYIERKPDPKNPGKYIYIYERPDGTRYEEQEPEQVHSVRPFTEDDFKPKEPSLFDQPEDTPKKPFLHLPEGPFSPSKAKEFAEKNKHLIGDGITYKALIDPEIDDDEYDYIVHMIQALAHTGNETTIPYEEVENKAAQYDLSAIDEDGKLRKLLQPDRYMPVSGPFLLKQMNSLQIKYDKKHPAPSEPKLIDDSPEPAKKKDLNTQVKELLDAKQKNKSFKDLNERVSGSRKEAAALKKLQAEEILKLDNATQYERINKKLAMPDYDPHAAKEAGVKAGVVYMNMKIRDSIAAKPVNSPVARQIYVKFMPALLEELENAPTIDDMKVIFRKYFVTGYTEYGHRTKKEVLFTQAAMDKFKELGLDLPTDNIEHLMMPPEAVLGRVFCGIAGQTTDTAKNHWTYAQNVSGITDHEIEESKKDWIERLKAGYERAYIDSDDKVDKMGPHELGNELSKYKVVPDSMLSIDKWSKKFWKQDHSEEELNQIMGDFKEKRRARIKEEMEDDKAIEAKAERMATINGNARPNNWEFLPSKAAEVTDGAAPDAKIDKKKVSDSIKQFPKLLRIIRTNGREVTDAEVTVENLHDLFGYRTVQLGNWVKDHEAKEHIKHFIGSMKDMEDVLGLDLKKMNESAGLSIAFGARGSGSALAHYEPMRKIINLTKTKGDGSIAHEWGHFFDHYLGGAEGDKLETEGYATARKAVHPEVKQVIDELLNEITTGRVLKTETYELPVNTPKAQYRIFNFIMNSSNIPDDQREAKLTEEARRLMERYPDKEEEIGQLAAYALKKPLTIEFEGVNKFYANSLKQKNKKYWANRQELFARAWEAYVEDKLAENGLYNNYLVSGSKSGTSDRAAETFSVYPQGEIRGRLNKIFDRLIERTKQAYGVAKELDTETPRVNEIIDYTGKEGDEELFTKSIITSVTNRQEANRRLNESLNAMLRVSRSRKEVSSFTKSAGDTDYPTYGKIDFQGLTIIVENKPGTVRRGTDPDGEKWKTKMFYPYGYIEGTKATDGEGVDVYVGKNRDSQKVFIIHQKDLETKKYDEDKVMLGFDTKEGARDAYLAHYDTYEFLGEITEMSLDEFREKLKTRKGKIIKSGSFLARLLKAFKKKFAGTPDWQLEFDFGDNDKETPTQGATNERGETLLPSKVNPQVNRWQKQNQVDETLEDIVTKPSPGSKVLNLFEDDLSNSVSESELTELRLQLEKKWGTVDIHVDKTGKVLLIYDGYMESATPTVFPRTAFRIYGGDLSRHLKKKNNLKTSDISIEAPKEMVEAVTAAQKKNQVLHQSLKNKALAEDALKYLDTTAEFKLYHYDFDRLSFKDDQTLNNDTREYLDKRLHELLNFILHDKGKSAINVETEPERDYFTPRIYTYTKDQMLNFINEFNAKKEADKERLLNQPDVVLNWDSTNSKFKVSQGVSKVREVLGIKAPGYYRKGDPEYGDDMAQLIESSQIISEDDLQKLISHGVKVKVNGKDTAEVKKPDNAEIQKEANEHPGTFEKIQQGEIQTPEDLGEAIAQDHQNKQEASEETSPKDWDLDQKPTFENATMRAEEGLLLIDADYNKYKGGSGGNLWIAKIPAKDSKEWNFLKPYRTHARDGYSGMKAFEITEDGVYAYNNFQTKSSSERVYFTVKDGKVYDERRWDLFEKPSANEDHSTTDYKINVWGLNHAELENRDGKLMLIAQRINPLTAKLWLARVPYEGAKRFEFVDSYQREKHPQGKHYFHITSDGVYLYNNGSDSTDKNAQEKREYFTVSNGEVFAGQRWDLFPQEETKKSLMGNFREYFAELIKNSRKPKNTL